MRMQELQDMEFREAVDRQQQRAEHGVAVKKADDQRDCLEGDGKDEVRRERWAMGNTQR